MWRSMGKATKGIGSQRRLLSCVISSRYHVAFHGPGTSSMTPRLMVKGGQIRDGEFVEKTRTWFGSQARPFKGMELEDCLLWVVYNQTRNDSKPKCVGYLVAFVYQCGEVLAWSNIISLARAPSPSFSPRSPPI